MCTELLKCTLHLQNINCDVELDLKELYLSTKMYRMILIEKNLERSKYIMYDYHMHSKFSPDGANSLEEMIKSAIEKNAKEICITDHVELSSPYGDEIFDIGDYKETISDLRKKYPELTIKSGAELGLQLDNLDRLNDFVERGNFDFVLGSVHSAEGFGIHEKAFVGSRNWDEVVTAYFENLYGCIKIYKNYDVVGHLDVIKRYHEPLRDFSFDRHYEIVDAILKLIIQDGKGIEINTGGLRYSYCNDINPTRDLLERYKKLGGEIITFGSDSHNINDILHGYGDVKKLLLELGYCNIATFENRKVRFVAL